MKKLLLSFGLLIVAQGASVVHAIKFTDESYEAAIKQQEAEDRSPKLYVLGARVDYPDIIIARNVQEVPDDLIAEALSLYSYGDKPEELAKALARLQAIHELTPADIEQKKKQHEEYRREREKIQRERAKKARNVGAVLEENSLNEMVLDPETEALIKKEEEEDRLPKLYVMGTRVRYPQILVARNARNVPDDLLIQSLYLYTYGHSEPEELPKALARLKAMRELTPAELGQKKKQYEEYRRERERRQRDYEEAVRKGREMQEEEMKNSKE